MPKMKTNSGAKKRFSVTGSGHIRRERAFKNHILTSKTRKRKRMLRQATLVSAQDEQSIKRLLCLR
jgi:large subunit ribosomal protein L35